MKYLKLIFLTVIITFFCYSNSFAGKGFTIRGGLYFDAPNTEIFEKIENGLGFQGTFGYNPFERVGFELGVFKSTHTYRLGRTGQYRDEDEAVKTTVFLKVRGIPYRYEKFEIVVGVGPSYYSISANKRDSLYTFPLSVEYSGLGLITSLDVRYYITENMAVTGYMVGNFVQFTKYYDGIQRGTVENPPDLPRGDSIGWGVSIFYWIGMNLPRIVDTSRR